MKRIHLFWVMVLFSSQSLARMVPTRQSQSADAETQGKTLDECYQASLKRSDQVAINTELITQAESVYRQAVGSVLPNLSGSGAYQWQQNTSAGGYSSIFPDPSTSTKLTVTQPLFQGFKEFAGLRQTKTLAQAAKYDKWQAATQLYLDTATAYFAVVTLEQDIDNVKDELKYYDDRIAELKRFVRIGRNQATDELTAEAQKAALYAQMRQIEGQLRAQRAVLTFLTGWDVNVPMTRPQDENVPARELEIYLSRLDSRPDVMSDANRKSAAHDSISVARAGHFPTLSFQGDYYLERTGALKDVKWDALFMLTVPLFSGGLVSAQVEQASSVANQAEFQHSKTRKTAEQQVKQFYENYMGDRNQYQAYKLATDLAEKNYQEEIKNFRRGLVTNLDVLTALTTFQESKRSKDKARFSMLQDFADVEAAGAYRPEMKDLPQSYEAPQEPL